MTKPDALEAVIAAFRERDVLRAVDSFAREATFHERGKPVVVGREAIRERFEAFARESARWRFDVDDVLRGSKRACVLYRFAFEGTGERARERAGIALVEVNDAGEISLWREYEG